MQNAMLPVCRELEEGEYEEIASDTQPHIIRVRAILWRLYGTGEVDDE